MGYSAKFAKVKNYYDKGLWTKKMVENAVLKGWITIDEYNEITEKMIGEGHENV